jgi:hypothetical protein
MRLIAEVSAATRIPITELREYTPGELATLLAVLRDD